LHHYLPEEIAGLNISKAFQNLCLEFGQFWKAFRYAKGVLENLAQGGALAEPWVNRKKYGVALKERNPVR
jgi:hypothetical protein